MYNSLLKIKKYFIVTRWEDIVIGHQPRDELK